MNLGIIFGGGRNVEDIHSLIFLFLWIFKILYNIYIYIFHIENIVTFTF